MNIRIDDGKNKFTFNLHKELKVIDDTVTNSAKEQPAIYAYLSMLHKRAISIVKNLEVELDDAKAKAISRLYEKTGNKSFSKDTFMNNKKYKKIFIDLIKAENYRDDLMSCVRAFEQRKDLIQTISANNRKEN